MDGALNIAPAERWVLRLQAGATTEQPQFDAWFASITAEFAVADRVWIYATGRYYRDTGEIENALLFTSAAPGLWSRQAGVGLRWQGEAWSLRVQLGSVHGRYEPTNPDLDFFQNLYRDRNWRTLQVAVGRTF